jgi:multidrug efflux pump
LQVVARLRGKLNQIPGIRTFMFPAQDLRVGGRQSDAQYQFTLWSADIDELQKWVPRVVDRVKRVPGIVDVTTDREQGGLQANIVIDREAAARFGVRVQDIDNALNNAFSQRQISTIYGPRNQYRVILEVDAAYQRDPTDLAQIYVPGNGNAQVPLSVVTKYERGVAPLVVNHQGQFPSVTITYNLAPNALIDDVTRSLEQAVAEMHIPDVIRADFSGDIQAYKQAVGAQPLLLLAALVRGLHRARRVVREPRAPPHDHLHAAISGPRSACWPSRSQGPNFR